MRDHATCFTEPTKPLVLDPEESVNSRGELEVSLKLQGTVNILIEADSDKLHSASHLLVVVHLDVLS